MNAQGLRSSASEAMIADASGVVALSLWNKQRQHFTALATAYDQMEGFPVIRLQGGCKCAKDLRQAIGKRIE